MKASDWTFDYKVVYQDRPERDGPLWTVVVKDDAQFGLFQNKVCVRFCVTVAALRRDFEELTGTKIPKRPDPFMGCENIKEYRIMTGVYDTMEGN